jgi:hypothetical protein
MLRADPGAAVFVDCEPALLLDRQRTLNNGATGRKPSDAIARCLAEPDISRTVTDDDFGSSSQATRRSYPTTGGLISLRGGRRGSD